MLLDNLRIRNFRMLDDFLVPSLGRVNLIVGRNNSGKSTVLEALRILAARGNPRVLLSILTDHDETALDEADQAIVDDDAIANAFRYLFPERRFPVSDDFSIQIGGLDSDLLKIEHLLYRTETEDIPSDDGELFEKRAKRVLIRKDDPSDFSNGVGQTLRITIGNNPDFSRSAHIDFEGGRARLRRHPLWDTRILSEIPCSYVPTDFMSQDDLSDLWDRVALTSFGDKVLNAMGLIDPRLQGLAFIKAGNTVRRYPGARAIESRIPVVKLAGSDERIPLNSMGDGMLRVLQLVLAILPAQGGFLLIDEFENGLYYGVQEEVWKLVFQLATELNIQVFATTHSQDCIRSFARAAKSHPEEGVLFKLSRSRAASDNNKIIATLYSEDQLAFAADTDMEVR